MEKKFKDKKLVELGFDEADEFGKGISAMSVVTRPAIMGTFITLKEDEKPQEIHFETMDKEKRLLIGPALIPDLPIFRLDKETNEEYYAYMTAETIEKLAYSFLKNGRQNNATIEHEVAAEGMTVVESWIIGDSEKDKAASLSMKYPKGTWMIAMKVNNDHVWTEWIKKGVLTGFSIEGMLYHKNEKKSAKTEQSEEMKRFESAVKALNIIYNYHDKAKRKV